MSRIFLHLIILNHILEFGAFFTVVQVISFVTNTLWNKEICE